MKKAIIIMAGLFAILNFSNSAYAAAVTWSTGSAGAAFTMGSTNTLDYNPSPGVLINGGNDVTTYCILSGNAKAGADALVYNVASASGEVGQKAVDLSGTSVSASSLGTPSTNGTLLTDFATK